MIIDRTATHDILARPNHDEAARTQYVVQLKRRLTQLQPGNEKVFRARAAKRHEAATGQEPHSQAEIGEAMAVDPYYQLWSALSCSAQELMWNSVEETIQRDLPRMQEAASRFSNAPAGGTLSLARDFDAPGDAFAAHIHGQPGGYMRDAGGNDIIAGALYESGGNAFSAGTGIGAKDSKSAAVIDFLEERYGTMRPLRILDLACSAGGASVGYAARFPDAEVHAVDVAPAMLRYAHLRAEAMGLKVHFHQMDAARLDFEDESFDLVISHNMMHEVSRPMLGKIFAEARRVLKPGGVVVHQDVPVKGADFSEFEKFMFAWQTKNNNEPFWDDFLNADVPAVMRENGFADDEVVETTVKMRDGPRSWYLVLGEKPDARGQRGTALKS
ncbi:MAG: class I SAM-dependent methyltransferase [Glycocaulis sp.]